MINIQEINTQEIREKTHGVAAESDFITFTVYELCDEVDRLRIESEAVQEVKQLKEDLETERKHYSDLAKSNVKLQEKLGEANERAQSNISNWQEAGLEISKLRKDLKTERECNKLLDIKNVQLTFNLETERKRCDNLIERNIQLQKDLKDYSAIQPLSNACEVHPRFAPVLVGLRYKGDEIMLQTRHPEQANKFAKDLLINFYKVA